MGRMFSSARKEKTQYPPLHTYKTGPSHVLSLYQLCFCMDSFQFSCLVFRLTMEVSDRRARQVNVHGREGLQLRGTGVVACKKVQLSVLSLQ